MASRYSTKINYFFYFTQINKLHKYKFFRNYKRWKTQTNFDLYRAVLVLYGTQSDTLLLRDHSSCSGILNPYTLRGYWARTRGVPRYHKQYTSDEERSRSLAGSLKARHTSRYTRFWGMRCDVASLVVTGSLNFRLFLGWWKNTIKIKVGWLMLLL